MLFPVPAMAADDIREEETELIIARLIAENQKLHEEKQAALSLRDSLQRELNSKREEVHDTYKKILRSEKSHEEALLELRKVEKERYSLTDAHGEQERRIDLLHEEFTSIILSVLAAQGDLEERFERKMRALQFLSEKALRMLKWTRETVCEEEGAQGRPIDGGEVDDERMKTMIEPFVVEVEKIRQGLLKLGIGRIEQEKTLCSMFAYPYNHKGEEKPYASPHGSVLNHGAKMPRTSNSLEKIQTFRQSVPPKSAAGSGLSSPEQSPRRLSTGCYPLSYAHMQGPQFWSVQEVPSFDKKGFSSRNSLEKFGHSSDWSPLNSPTRRNQSLRTASPSGATAPLHSKTPSDSSAAWHEGLVSVLPLPLPPAASVPSQPAYPPPTKSEVSSMTSQWQKGKLIGSGTVGNVYVATNRETGALCAMKEVNLIPDDPKSAECMQQLEQEIKVFSQFKHPNIVQYYGSEIVEDRFYIFLEYVHPGSISKYVRDHCGAMTESVVRNFTRHILSGLDYLHSKKTIHGDIKGANLLVDASGVVKLADFGMAKHLSGQAAALSMKGSPYWMAPEVMQAMMHKDSGYDLAVDIWSLGCTIIEMFTGKPPWSEYEGAAAMFKVIKNDPPIPEMLSPEGKDFLQCCFRRNPLERPSANLLLEHRFVRNSNQTHDIPGCIQAIPRMKLSVSFSSRLLIAQVFQTADSDGL